MLNVFWLRLVEDVGTQIESCEKYIYIPTVSDLVY